MAPKKQNFSTQMLLRCIRVINLHTQNYTITRITSNNMAPKKQNFSTLMLFEVY